MTGRALALGAALGLLLAAGVARADAFWFGDQATRPIGPDGWYVGSGAVVGVYQLPSWNAPIALFPGSLAGDEITIYGPAQRTIFNPAVPFAGPGLTLGRTIAPGQTPQWAGKRLRVYLSGMYWAGRAKDSATTGTTFADALNVSAVDGRTHRYTSYVPGSLDETLRTRHRRLEFQLGVSTDYDVSPITVLTPSVALVGGWQRERYRYDAFNRRSGVGPVGPLMYDERNSTIRVGLDTGLTTAVQAAPTVRVFATVRTGLHWLHTRFHGRDCYDGNARGTICSVAPGTFTTNSHATSTSDSASTWSFRGSLSFGMTWTPRPFIVQLGSFFTWESAVPGIANPVLLNQPTANGTTRIAPARIRFDDGWNVGAYVVIRLPLNGL